MNNFKGQIGIEYMIVLSFVTLAIMVVLTFSIVFSSQVQDRIKLNQVENFAIQLVNSAETVFFAGEPSKTTIMLSLPAGVKDITVVPEGLVFQVVTTSGQNTRLFESNVPLQGSVPTTEGVHKITLTATEDFVEIS